MIVVRLSICLVLPVLVAACAESTVREPVTADASSARVDAARPDAAFDALSAAAETIVWLVAGPEFSGAVVRVNGDARTLDADGRAQWTVRPAIFDESIAFEMELDGVTESHTIELAWWRPYIEEPYAALPLDEVDLYFARNVTTGECDAGALSVSASAFNASGALGGVDQVRCGPFVPSCEETSAQVEAFVAESSACISHADCTFFDASCWRPDACCTYLGPGADRVRWHALMTYAAACGGRVMEFPSCGCSCTAPARCIEGHCGPG